MKGYFNVDIAVELPKYRTESNKFGRKQYLKGPAEIPDDEYPILKGYFKPEINLETALKSGENKQVEPETPIEPETKEEKVELTEELEEEKALESPENKMTTSRKKK